MEAEYTLQTVRDEALRCTRCPLHKTRTKVVWGTGSERAAVMFIGEGPGEHEDEQGIPFVGRAGQLLDDMLKAIQLDRSQVYIANVVKCRPPGNRNPAPEEIASCLDYLRWQVRLIRPKILVCLGAVAARTVIGPEIKVSADRGRWIKKGNYSLLATYHPAALLRDSDKKKESWQDLQMLQAALQEFADKRG